jgi:hypothetical protein
MQNDGKGKESPCYVNTLNVNKLNARLGGMINIRAAIVVIAEVYDLSA